MALMVLLGGCSSRDSGEAGDDVSGQWSSEARIESIDIGGHYLEGSAIPAAFQAYAKTEPKCLTGNVASREEMEQTLEKNLGGHCDIDVYNASDRVVDGSGKCEQMGDPSWDYQPQFSFDGSRTDSEGQVSFALEGGANDVSTGQRTWIKILVKVDMQRVGDC